MKRLLEVKKKIGTLSKNSKNPFYKSQYLDLHSLLEAVEPLLQEQGLILLQPIIGNSINTQIIDSKDGNILAESSIELPEEFNPQKLGIAITYFRRYTLTSLLAISETDNDGNISPVKKKLDEEGFQYLMKKGTKDQIKTALKDRIVSAGNKVDLENKLEKK